jgi:hypothetical protein
MGSLRVCAGETGKPLPDPQGQALPRVGRVPGYLTLRVRYRPTGFN